MNQEVIKLNKPKRNSEKDIIWRKENKERLNRKSIEWNKNNKERLKEYRIGNKEKILKISKQWQKENKERAREIHKQYRERNKEKINKATRLYIKENREKYLQTRKLYRERKKEDPLYMMTERIRSLIGQSFKRGKNKMSKNLHTEDILGCSIEYFIDYILTLCPEGICVSDFGRYKYHLDHIIPISSAKNEEDIIKLCHYTNFRPLWWKDNIVKRDKIVDNELYLQLIND